MATVLLTMSATAELRTGKLTTSAEGRSGTMHFYRFHNEKVSLKVIPKGSFANLKAAMKAHKCVAGSNGGFFDPENHPLGEVIASGTQSGRPNLASSLTSGVIYQHEGFLTIERSKAFYQRKLTPAPSQLLQTGPFLIEAGKPVTGLSNRRPARRTFIATNGKGEWFLARTPFITLAQLAQSLATSEQRYGFKIDTALNLDGGSSSALWAQRGGGKEPLYLREFKPVANYIGFVAK